MVLFAALACRTAPTDPCVAGPDPTLTIGLGDLSYQPVPAGGDFPLTHGPQGGFHLAIGLLATGISADGLVSARMEGTIDGKSYALVQPWLDFRCDPQAGGRTSYGTRLIYAATPDFLDGKRTAVEVTVTDLEGTDVSARSTFTIRDAP